MLLDNAKADQPERRIALVATELSHYKTDIAALSADEGQLTEIGGGQPFLEWTQKCRATRSWSWLCHQNPPCKEAVKNP